EVADGAGQRVAAAVAAQRGGGGAGPAGAGGCGGAGEDLHGGVFAVAEAGAGGDEGPQRVVVVGGAKRQGVGKRRHQRPTGGHGGGRGDGGCGGAGGAGGAGPGGVYGGFDGAGWHPAGYPQVDGQLP